MKAHSNFSSGRDPASSRNAPARPRSRRRRGRCRLGELVRSPSMLAGSAKGPFVDLEGEAEVGSQPLRLHQRVQESFLSSSEDGCSGTGWEGRAAPPPSSSALRRKRRESSPPRPPRRRCGRASIGTLRSRGCARAEALRSPVMAPPGQGSTDRCRRSVVTGRRSRQLAPPSMKPCARAMSVKWRRSTFFGSRSPSGSPAPAAQAESSWAKW